MGKPGGKRSFERPRRRGEDNIKLDLLDLERSGMDWIDLDQDRDSWWALVNVVMNIRFPQNVRNFLTS